MNVVVNINERIYNLAEKFRLSENNPRRDRYIKIALLHCRKGEMCIQLGKIYTGGNYTPNEKEVKYGLCYAAQDGLIVEIGGKIKLTPEGAKVARGYGFKVPYSAIYREPELAYLAKSA